MQHESRAGPERAGPALTAWVTPFLTPPSCPDPPFPLLCLQHPPLLASALGPPLTPCPKGQPAEQRHLTPGLSGYPSGKHDLRPGTHPALSPAQRAVGTGVREDTFAPGALSLLNPHGGQKGN